METLLCILLYLEVICSPCEYYEYQIEDYEKEYQEDIEAIKDDEDYLDNVIADYEDAASEVVIREKDELNSAF